MAAQNTLYNTCFEQLYLKKLPKYTRHATAKSEKSLRFKNSAMLSLLLLMCLSHRRSWPRETFKTGNRLFKKMAHKMFAMLYLVLVFLHSMSFKK